MRARGEKKGVKVEGSVRDLTVWGGVDRLTWLLALPITSPCSSVNEVGGEKSEQSKELCTL